MAVLDIAQIGHPILRERAREVSADELASPQIQQLIDDMIETMRHANGAGIAANQVKRAVRICVLEVANNKRYPYKPNIPLTVLVNPVIEHLGDATFDNYEGCLSVPNLRGMVKRHTQIRVRALTRDGEPYDREIRGLTAGTFQHEVDHLDGKLFVDRVTDPHTLCTWDQYKAHHERNFVEQVATLVARFGS
jgi:peptide deformylase